MHLLEILTIELYVYLFYFTIKKNYTLVNTHTFKKQACYNYHYVA